MEIVLRMINYVKRLIDKIWQSEKEATEAEISMNEETKDAFYPLYDELMKHEDSLRQVMTDYATGKDVNMIAVDVEIKKVKTKLKEIRELAIESKKEQHGE